MTFILIMGMVNLFNVNVKLLTVMAHGYVEIACAACVDVDL